MTVKKTNAMRLLERAHIRYEIREYEVDESDLSAESVARKIGLPEAQVFKTLVVRGDKTLVLLAVVPAGTELDLKALAFVSGNKRVEMVSLAEIEPLTGYIRGGVSPLGTKKRYPVYMDETALQFPVISISAGIRGCQLLVPPTDLIQVVSAVIASLSRSV